MTCSIVQINMHWMCLDFHLVHFWVVAVNVHCDYVLCVGLYSPLLALIGFVIIIFLIYWLVTAFELHV